MQMLANMVDMVGVPGTVGFAGALIIALGLLVKGLYRRNAKSDKRSYEEMYGVVPKPRAKTLEDLVHESGDE